MKQLYIDSKNLKEKENAITTVVNIDNKFDMNISPRDNVQSLSNADMILESINSFIRYIDDIIINYDNIIIKEDNNTCVTFNPRVISKFYSNLKDTNSAVMAEKLEIRNHPFIGKIISINNEKFKIISVHKIIHLFGTFLFIAIFPTRNKKLLYFTSQHWIIYPTKETYSPKTLSFIREIAEKNKLKYKIGRNNRGYSKPHPKFIKKRIKK